MSESQSPLLAATLELKLCIISFLRLSDKRRLRLTCQLFNNLLALDVPHEQLRVAQKKKTILLVDGANEGEPGNEPFFIFNVQKVHNSSSSSAAAVSDTSTAALSPPSEFHPTQESEKQLLFDVYHPMFMCNERETGKNVAEWVIHIAMRELELDKGHDINSNFESRRIVKSVNYKSSAKIAGMCAQGVEGSAPDSIRYFLVVGTYQTPCPVCIGYEMALSAKRLQNRPEDLEKLWDPLYEMLEEEKDR
ncbi:hypothetical protein BDP27DRAFT_1424935 [Rhodocollybia butyracea]|uniref:F-box domain-containing protein n=1 Tax=Rhodocollybia butyracea TaxID=206335 RepID=A0A9P5U3X4_9AGAR|nr:hypothetical protein BDP27DRAFT_1424935 [Rhodocollybia butyracea]